MIEPSHNACPVIAYELAGENYIELVSELIAEPHRFFRCFGPEARQFQKRNPSPRLRTMTLVAPAEELSRLLPVRICLDRRSFTVISWEEIFSVAVSRLIIAHPETFSALQRDGELEWLGCRAEDVNVGELLSSGMLQPSFADHVEVVARVQWLFLVCGIRLNEVIVQVNPYTDEEWKIRREELRIKRNKEHQFMTGRRAAQRAWAAANGGTESV